MDRLASARSCHRAGGGRGGERAKTISPLSGSARLQPQPIRTKRAQLAVWSWDGAGGENLSRFSVGSGSAVARSCKNRQVSIPCGGEPPSFERGSAPDSYRAARRVRRSTCCSASIPIMCRIGGVDPFQFFRRSAFWPLAGLSGTKKLSLSQARVVPIYVVTRKSLYMRRA